MGDGIWRETVINTGQLGVPLVLVEPRAFLCKDCGEETKTTVLGANTCLRCLNKRLHEMYREQGREDPVKAFRGDIDGI